MRKGEVSENIRPIERLLQGVTFGDDFLPGLFETKFLVQFLQIKTRNVFKNQI